MLSAEEWQFVQQRLALSPRELEIVQHVYDDRSELAIARDLAISEHTVHTYLRRIYRKLGVASRCQLLRRVFDTYLSEGQTIKLQRGDGIQPGSV